MKWTAEVEYLSAEHKTTTGMVIIRDENGEFICKVPRDKAAIIASGPDILLELKASNNLLFGLLDYFEPGHELSQINAQRDRNIAAIAKAEER